MAKNFKVMMNAKNIKVLTENQKIALVQAVDAAKTDLIHSQTIPFDTGTLQNESTYIDEKKKDKGEIRIVSDTPYARKLYFSPKLNFQTVNNPNAGAYWFEPYMSGSKNGFMQETYKKRLEVLNERSGD
jgi:hypothetical protein